MTQKIGFIGMGIMGLPMAANIIVPTKKQWEILSPILAELGEGGVIVAPDVVEELN